MTYATTDVPPVTHAPQDDTVSTGVHILSLILFAGFAIPVTIIMVDEFWPAGFALAIVFAAFWPSMKSAKKKGLGITEVESIVKDLVPTSKPRSSGNASFDAYRTDVMERLEAEQVNFETFLERLREAKDKTEFDQFMDDRASLPRDDA